MQGGNPDWKRAFPAGKAKGRKKYAGGRPLLLCTAKTQQQQKQSTNIPKKVAISAADFSIRFPYFNIKNASPIYIKRERMI